MRSQRSANILRADLPPLPARMKRLRVDERGYPIPWFVSYVDGRPEFRVYRVDKLLRANRSGLCWICGNKAGRVHTFILGAVHALTRMTSQPPCHAECARFAVMTCPFFAAPIDVRRSWSTRNPGVTCLWTTSAFRARYEDCGLMYRLGDPTQLEIYAEKRPATREEALAAMDAVMPMALQVADDEGLIRMRIDLEGAYCKMLPLLPAA